MPSARRHAGGRNAATKYRGMSRTRKQIGIQNLNETRGTPLAAFIGAGMLLILILGLALMFIIAHRSGIASASGGGSGSGVPVGYGSLNHPKGSCGNAGQAPCPAADPGWFPITSESLNSVATAIAGSNEYTGMQGRFGYVALDTPALVHAYGAHTGNDYYDDDHWVVSVRNASGMRSGIFDFVYDRTHQRMRFSSYGVLTSQDPHSRQAFPYISLSTAVARLQSQRGLSVMAGTHPELIFFPIDPSFPDLNSPVHKWAGGGNSAMNPMWHLVGSDGQDYFVGIDLNAHAQAELPIAQGQP